MNWLIEKEVTGGGGSGNEDNDFHCHIWEKIPKK